MPASIGLRGDAYAEAEANYYLSGIELDKRIMEIRYKNEPEVLEKKLLDIDLKHRKIDQYKYDIDMNSCIHYNDQDAKHLAQIDIDLRHKKITEYEAAHRKIKHEHGEAGKDYDFAVIGLDLQYKKLSEYEAAVKYAKLEYREGSKELKIALIDIRRDYGKLTEYQAEMKKLDVLFPDDTHENEKELAKLEVEFKLNKLPKNAYEKAKATLKDEPWVSFANSDFNPKEGLDGVYVSLEWNAQFIDLLTMHGFVGHTEEQIIEEWFAEVCRTNNQQEMPPNPGIYPMGYDGSA